MRKNGIIIAIDGYSSCGKSTLAKQLAKELNYIFIDSGAMYRAITLFAMGNSCFNKRELNINRLTSLLPSIQLKFTLNQNGSPEIELNNEKVEAEIRQPKVSDLVSIVAAIPEVREKLVEEQRKIGKNGGIVMDGRDIGTVVFPDAELKIFVTADIDTRAKRRYKELNSKKISATLEEVKKNLAERDHLDSTRKTSPLKQADDAIVVDNTNLTPEGQLAHVLDLFDKLQPKLTYRNK